MKYSAKIQRFDGGRKFSLPPEGPVLVRTSNWLGDAVMSLPAVWQLKRLLGNDRPLAVLAPSKLTGIWESVPFVDKVISFEGNRIDAAAKAEVKAFAPLFALILPNSFGSAWDVYSCGVPKLLGRAGNLRSWMLKYRLPRWQSVKGKGYAQFHQVSYYLDLVASLGNIDFSSSFPRLSVMSENLQNLGNSPLILAPGAAFGPAKQWPLDYFVEIGRRWLSANRGSVVVVGTRKEIGDIDFGEFGFVDLVGKTSLKQLMSALAQASYVVSNDSGTMHLAAALGVPGCAVFGSTDPYATGPLAAIAPRTGQPAEWKYVLPNSLQCCPCFMRNCPNIDEKSKYSCLKGILPDQVWAEM